MPSLAEHKSANLVKMLYIGNSGAGKTGSLASLVTAGYKLHICDYDNGLDYLASKIREADPELLKNVDFETFTDTYKVVGSRPTPQAVNAWSNSLKWLDAKIKVLGEDDVLVVDSLTLGTKGAFNWVLQANARLATGKKEIQDWGAAQDITEAFLSMPYSDDVKCNLIITSHITYYGEGDNDIKQGFPSTAVGKAFSPKIGRYFNAVLLARKAGTGAGTKREIHTQPIDYVDLKSSSPTAKGKYPLETGVADYFKDVLGKTPSSK